MRLPVAALLVFVVVPSAAQDEAARLRSARDLVDQMARRALRESGAPGLAVAITTRGGLLWESSYGFANKDAQSPITADTLFGIGSIGKSFTAVSILALRDAGKINVRSPISEYLPWFRVDSTVPITAHHLLTHTSGLPSMRMELMSSIYQAFWLTEGPFPFVPEKQYYYSSSGFDVLSTVIEAVSHQPYGQFVRRTILDPLGMTASEPVFVTRIRPRLATSYERLYDDRPSRPDDPLVPSNWYEYGGGAGSVAATARDLAAYARMILNRGAGSNGKIVSEESFQLLTQHAVQLGPDRYYGYALNITEKGGHTFVGHGGGVQGFRSSLRTDMEQGLGVVVLTNGPANVEAVAEVALEAATAALNNQKLPPLPASAAPPSNLAEYAGEYADSGGTRLVVRAGDGRLTLHYRDRSVPLQPAGNDVFLCADPDFELYPIRFQRAKHDVVEAIYGPDWYANAGYTGPRTFDSPPEWTSYPGHYRTSTRQHVNFRIVLRKGKLRLINPGGDEMPLNPIKPGWFRLGDTPEWLHFDEVLDGKTLRVNYSGTEFHRDFTP